MAGISSISGLIAGFDTKGAVDELLGAEKARIDSLTLKQSNETDKQNELSKFNSMMQNLRNTSIAMATTTDFFSYTASLSSSSSVPASSLLSVSGTNSVSIGSHSIKINKLALAQKESSSAPIQDSAAAAASSDTSALGLSGSFTINGTSVTVTVADSIQDIAASINQLNTGSSATGVSAAVIKAGTNDYRLVLSAGKTGAANGFTLAGADLSNAATLGKLNLSVPSHLQAEQDAQVVIDGLTITRASNSISDALTGVTMDLLQADSTTTLTMNVAVDTVALQANAQQFVDDYNAVQDYINGQYAVDPKTGKNGLLAGEITLRSVQTALSGSLLQTVQGVASDRNSLVRIGVEPDSKGHLGINDTLFSTFLNSDPNAIRDVFAVQGSSSNRDLSFLVNGLNTPSGSYAVNITTAATRASLTGSNDLVNNTLGTFTAGANDVVSITETTGARLATVSLTPGLNQSGIITALNSEFDASYTEKHQLATALTVTGGAALTGSSTFAQLGLGSLNNDTISISGTSRSGAAVSGTYTMLNTATDTLDGLLSAIQAAFNQQVVASIDVSGHVVVTDSQVGDSQLSLTLTANNEGAGTLNFGADSVLTEGRNSLGVEALTSGNGVVIRSKNYGSTSGFSIAQSVNGLGITNQTIAGVDVAGTINGLAATGSGQGLTGTTGVVDSLTLFYGGTATGVVGSVTIGVGVAALFEGSLDRYSNPFDGAIQQSINQSQSTYDSVGKMIDDVQLKMEMKRAQLSESFARMEQAMSVFQSTGSFLTQQVNASTTRR
ncbi:MAG: flagellar filament capping protein FliD [Mariprofundaceae bacterium]